MKLVIIGAGNVATHLALALHSLKASPCGGGLEGVGIEICQIFSRTEESARALAERVNAGYTAQVSQIVRDVDVYLYAVADSALSDLASQINAPDALHIHTSGSTAMDIFADVAENYGVLYPLQTFSKHKAVNFAEIPIFVEGNSEFAKNKIVEIAQLLTEKLHFMDSDGRKKLHLSAVFVCNFVNHLYAVGAELVQDAGVSFDVLQPLIQETAEKIKTLAPRDAQTGPAVRKDKNIIQKHLKLLENKRGLAKIYRLITKDIQAPSNSPEGGGFGEVQKSTKCKK